MKKKLRENKGITLIALIVTIIILLILSGIAISMLSGENGILRQAAKAKRETEDKSNKEKLQMAVMSSMINTDHKINEEKLKDELKKVLGGTVEVISDGRNGYIIEKDGKTVGIVDKNGQIGEGKWHFSIEKGKELIITDGETELEIGDEINYDCTRDENEIQVTAGYTSKGGVNGYGADYTYNAKDYTGKWGILGVENGKILIMPMQNVINTSSTSTVLYLKGQDGYKNGVDELNKISEIYGHGRGADGARSIKIEDIDEVTGYNPNNVGIRDVAKTGSGTKYNAKNINEYGNKVTYYWNGDAYPYYVGSNGIKNSLTGTHNNFYWFDNSSKKWEKSGKSTSAKNTDKGRVKIAELTCNLYNYYPETLTDKKDESQSIGLVHDSKAYTMLFGNTSSKTHYYWIGSAYVHTGTDSIGSGIRWIDYGYVNGRGLNYSFGTNQTYSKGVRPVVSLKSDVKLKKEGDVWKIQ